MKLNIETRFQAFAIHLLISSVIFVSFLCLMFFLWYPPPYFELEGGWIILKILIGVDVILGPLLTLVIFKKGKPGLSLDLSLIAAMQLIALSYGGNIIYQERPVFIVFAIDRFTVVSAHDIDMDLLIGTDLTRKNHRGPIPVFAKWPDTLEERNKLTLGVLHGEADLEFRAEYYEHFIPNLKKALLRSKDASQYTFTEANKHAINKFLFDHGIKEIDFALFPVVGKNKDMLLAINKQNGKIIDAIDINPWLN